MTSKREPPREPHPIALYRARHNIVRKAFADDIGITEAALWRIEHGQTEAPNFKTVATLAVATKGEVSEIDIFRYHYAAAMGVVPALRVPMTVNFSWAWVQPRRDVASAAA